MDIPDFLVPVQKEHAELLYPLIYKTDVLRTIQWNGPTSLDEYTQGLKEREIATQNKSQHMFTIFDPHDSKAIGSIEIRPDSKDLRADIGLWIASKAQGKGWGSLAIKEITKYGFMQLKCQHIEAFIFVNNIASRRIFEKNHFRYFGTIKDRVIKNGKPQDQWHFQISLQEFKNLNNSSFE